MKKNSSMQGTLNKLFGKKNSNNNSLYADNPPWILTQGTKKSSDDYHDGTLNSFSFLDDSGTATLKARPGPRVRPVLQFSNSNTETQGLAVPTPSVPSVYSAASGNGVKINGNYRMYSSVGDLRSSDYSELEDEEIPAPPSMPPPPPPPSMPPPPPPPQENPLSSTVSSPASPSLPDFIPPTPNTSAPNPNHPLASPTFAPFGDQQQMQNASKWKSETVLNTLPSDLQMGLPNRFSLNPDLLHKNKQQMDKFDTDPHSTLPRSFKVPPPAPARISSIQQEQMFQPNDQRTSAVYASDPPRSPIPSSFNPSVQAKLFTTKEQKDKSLYDSINKRKSVIIMEDLKNAAQSTDLENTVENVGSINASTEVYGSVTQKPKADVPMQSEVVVEKSGGNKSNSIGQQQGDRDFFNKSIGFNNSDQSQSSKINKIKSELSSVSSKNNTTEYNKIPFNKNSYHSETSKGLKPTIKIISLKPLLGDSDASNAGLQFKNDTFTRKNIEIFHNEQTEMENKVYSKFTNDSESYGMEAPPSIAPPLVPNMVLPNPPCMPPPPPPPLATASSPSMVPPPPPLPPPKVLTMQSPSPPPAPPVIVPSLNTPRASPLMSPKLKALPAQPSSPMKAPTTLPPKAPPAPPPLPPPLPPNQTQQLPIIKALQAKEEHLKQTSQKEKLVEIKPAQPNFQPTDNEQKNRVGKIKNELEAFLASQMKDEKKLGGLKNSPPEANRKTSNVNAAPFKGGENTIVNSLMMKVPLLPVPPEKEETDADTSDWLPKSKEIEIPEPDYMPIPNKQDTKLKDLAPPVKITKPSVPLPVTPSTPIFKETTNVHQNSPNPVPSYKPHQERKANAGNFTFEPVSFVTPNPDPIVLKLDNPPDPVESKLLESPVKEESHISHQDRLINDLVTGEKSEPVSPMALLMAAKQRTQKGKHSVSLERASLPKVSVTSESVSGSFSHQYNDTQSNSFTVVPKLQHNLSDDRKTDQVGYTGSLRDSKFTLGNSNRTEEILPKSNWIDKEFQASNRQDEGSLKSSSVPIVTNSTYWRSESEDLSKERLYPTGQKPISTQISNIGDTAKFTISSCPSPTPVSRTDEELEYTILPPPAEFMNDRNSPTVPNMDSRNMQQQERPSMYDRIRDMKSDYVTPGYDRSYATNNAMVSQTTTSSRDYNKYSSDNYSMGVSRDSHKGSLIKKRLYMPEPESSRNYGMSTSTLRSGTPMSYNHMYSQPSSTMSLDQRRLSATSRYLAQGRRVSSENLNRTTLTDMKYKNPNQEYSANRPSIRPQQTSYPGMTFTVRPGTRQPISNLYQGGYL
ncbi:uncharacterized protein C6orf132 homolog [Bombina bombina]|uniref:uncharacterized protein C6orf132 homolog n=1 Tax=Bombina bombina TaxID=8345 RepID=UPI00235A877E|nr:uncharacterized protein C6orf132 homolog [Bombina bombina]